MRVVFIGCVRFSHTLLKHVLSLRGVEVVGIVTKDQSTYNADFCSLVPLAEKAGVPYLAVSGEHAQALRQFLEERKPDICFCFGWSHLLKADALSIPRLGIVGYHPTALPLNRGRHPIIWTLALGLEQTASTFFLMDGNADSGDILSQERVSVFQEDDAVSLYAKLESIALRQIEALVSSLIAGSVSRVPQDNTAANYWRKRTASDGKIDWRMPSSAIRNLVRALARPYPGAHFVHDGKEIKVWRVVVLNSSESTFANVEPGKVTDEK